MLALFLRPFLIWAFLKNRYKTKDCEAALYAYASVYSRINEINKYADMWMPKNT